MLSDVMSEKKLGTAIITENGNLYGIITDGDLRRLLQRVERPLTVNARVALEHSSRDGSQRTKPVTIEQGAYAARAVNLMEKHIIMALVVVDNTDKPIGLIRWIDLSVAGVI